MLISQICQITYALGVKSSYLTLIIELLESSLNAVSRALNSGKGLLVAKTSVFLVSMGAVHRKK